MAPNSRYVTVRHAQPPILASQQLHYANSVPPSPAYDYISPIRCHPATWMPAFLPPQPHPHAKRPPRSRWNYEGRLQLQGCLYPGATSNPEASLSRGAASNRRASPLRRFSSPLRDLLHLAQAFLEGRVAGDRVKVAGDKQVHVGVHPAVEHIDAARQHEVGHLDDHLDLAQVVEDAGTVAVDQAADGRSGCP